MIRIDRFLSQLKYGSRSEIATAIKNGLVTINGVLVDSPRDKIDPATDRIEFSGEFVFFKSAIVLMLNKPQNVLSANRDDQYVSVTGLIKPPYDRFDLNVAGRLDLDAEGLILLTNDGSLLHRIISPNKEVMKKYLVTLEFPLSGETELESGLDIRDGKGELYHTLPARIEKIDSHSCYISIHEGKYHQIKRMFQAVGNNVTHLKRVSIGNLSLDDSLAPGEYKELSEAEISLIFAKNGNDREKV